METVAHADTAPIEPLSLLHEVFGYTEFPVIGRRSYQLSLNPYGFFWFELQESAAPSAVAVSAAEAVTPLNARTWRELFESDSGEALLAAVLAGVGLAMLPTFLAGEHLASGKLVAVLTGYRIPEFGLYLVRPPPAAHQPRKLRVLTDLLVERFGGEPYWDACYLHRKAQKEATATRGTLRARRQPRRTVR